MCYLYKSVKKGGDKKLSGDFSLTSKGQLMSCDINTTFSSVCVYMYAVSHNGKCCYLRFYPTRISHLLTAALSLFTFSLSIATRRETASPTANKQWSESDLLSTHEIKSVSPYCRCQCSLCSSTRLAALLFTLWRVLYYVCPAFSGTTCQPGQKYKNTIQ